MLGRLLENAATPSPRADIAATTTVVYNAIVRDYVVSVDGLTTYMLGLDGTLRAYNSETGALVQSWVGITTSPGGLAISPDGSFLAVVERDPVSVTGSGFDTQTTCVTHRVDLATGAVTHYQFVATWMDYTLNDVEILADGRAYFTQQFNGSGPTRIWALDYSTGQYSAILNGQMFSSPSLTSFADTSTRMLVSVNNSGFAQQTMVDISSGSPVAVGSATPQGPAVGMDAVSEATGMVVLYAGGNILLYDANLNFVQNLSQIQPAFANIGGFNDITGFAFDATGANLYAVDTNARAILQVSTVNWQVVNSFDLPSDAFSFSQAVGAELIVGPDSRYFLLPARGQLLRVDNPTVTDAIAGTPNADVLPGTAGDDVIVGYQGADTMTGLGGNDRYYVDNAGDAVVEAAGGGNDTVFASASYALAAGSEVETLRTSSALAAVAIDLTGNALANSLIGNAGANRLDGGGGGDTLTGGKGDDTYVVHAGDTIVELAGQGNDRVLTALSYTLAAGVSVEELAADPAGGLSPIDLTANELALRLTGNDGVNALHGNALANILDGRGGADTMTGLGGDDLYHVDNAGDVVVEAASGGNDRVVTSLSFSLAAGVDVEQLDSAAGSAVINLTGNERDQTIRGNEAANLLEGMGGTDILRGDVGNDTLYGNDGNDFLVGGGGDDILVGGIGDDTYYIDSTSDAVSEFGGEGFDRIAATITLALAADADIERLDVENLASTNALDLTGSAIGNVIYGNDGVNILRGEAGNDELRGFAGNDFLVGGAGTDLMVGGLGDDTFYVDDASDAIGEITGEGNDRIAASVSFVLSNGANVEIIEAVNVAATTAFDLTGSDSANTITGNAGVNVLRGEGGNDILAGAGGDDFLVGGAGVDVMNGGTGNDTYYVDAQSDTVNEFAGEGTADRVVAAITFTLSADADVELLETASAGGAVFIDLTGSSIANTINGNAVANILDGKAGDDVLDGKGGSDILTGGSGADTFQFTTALGASNVDTVNDFVAGSDRFALDDARFAAIGPAGGLNASAFFIGTAAHDADDRIIYNSASGALLYDADGIGAGAAIQFAILQTGLGLAASDFVVI